MGCSVGVCGAAGLFDQLLVVWLGLGDLGRGLVKAVGLAVLRAHELGQGLGTVGTSVGVPHLTLPVPVGTTLLDIGGGLVLAVLAMPEGHVQVDAGGLSGVLLCHFRVPFPYARVLLQDSTLSNVLAVATAPNKSVTVTEWV